MKPNATCLPSDERNIGTIMLEHGPLVIHWQEHRQDFFYPSGALTQMNAKINPPVTFHAEAASDVSEATRKRVMRC
ncbi:MAG: hypothetical protein Q9P14_05140 [candidate division KSB1 bacterium]|nr:hypothetical protein [candidate division KSB1 bacterium]MDQ7065228.1 hypothetical protein [candidate division KSB1 bacterium]